MGRAPARSGVDYPITTSGAAPLIVDGFRRVRRSTFTEGAIMEKTEYHRHSRRAWQKRQKTRRDMERRTRRSPSTIGGAAPDTIIGRAAADRAGARPYRATHCENASKWATRFVQRDDGLILRTLSPNFALTPKLQPYRPGCLAVPTDVVRVRN